MFREFGVNEWQQEVIDHLRTDFKKDEILVQEVVEPTKETDIRAYVCKTEEVNTWREMDCKLEGFGGFSIHYVKDITATREEIIKKLEAL